MPDKASDAMLDHIFILTRNTDDAIRMLGRIVLANPALDTALTAVVMRLANTTDHLIPTRVDSSGTPIYSHQE